VGFYYLYREFYENGIGFIFIGFAIELGALCDLPREYLGRAMNIATITLRHAARVACPSILATQACPTNYDLSRTKRSREQAIFLTSAYQGLPPRKARW
jgi:hypothetical protein